MKFSRENICDVLCASVIVGGKRAAELMSQDLHKNDKGLGDFNTAADLESEKIIVSRLLEAFPGIQVISEETGNQQIAAENYFCVDPVDGTIIASKGCPEWGVSAAYVEEGRPVIGILFQPMMDRLIISEKNQGCYLNDKKIELSDKEKSDRLVLSYDITYLSKPEHLENFLLPIVKKNRVSILRGTGNAVGNCIELLLGHIDAYFGAAGGKVWDFAAAALAISEAGGATSDPFSEALRWDKLAMNVVFAKSKRCLNLVVEHASS